MLISGLRDTKFKQSIVQYQTIWGLVLGRGNLSCAISLNWQHYIMFDPIVTCTIQYIDIFYSGIFYSDCVSCRYITKLDILQCKCEGDIRGILYRDHSRYGLGQWEKRLHSNTSYVIPLLADPISRMSPALLCLLNSVIFHRTKNPTLLE